MKELDSEELIQEMTEAVKHGADLSVWKKNRKFSPLVNLMENLHHMPKTSVPTPDLHRVREQILDRISIPVEVKQRSWFISMLPTIARFSIGAIASVLIVISLGLGTAVAALNSVPGQTIYPLKIVVENIQLQLASEADKPALQLKFANNRVDELQQVLDQKDAGKISNDQAQKIIAQTVQDFQKTTTDAVSGTTAQPKVVDTLTDLGNKIIAASAQQDPAVKAELDKALQTTKVSQEVAIKNLENAGLKVDDTTLTITASDVTASGKLTAVTDSSLSIGTAKFLITKDTVYDGLTAADLKVDLVVKIEAQVTNNKTYATKITLVPDPQTSGASTVTPDSAPDSSTSTDTKPTTSSDSTTPALTQTTP